MVNFVISCIHSMIPNNSILNGYTDGLNTVEVSKVTVCTSGVYEGLAVRGL